jgi:hypothetical protein
MFLTNRQNFHQFPHVYDQQQGSPTTLLQTTPWLSIITTKKTMANFIILGT